MKRYSNNDNIDNDLSRIGYSNTSPKNFNQPLNLNHKINTALPGETKSFTTSSDLLPRPNKNPFHNINNDYINSNLNFRQTDKINHEQAQHTTELINSKDKTIDSMNSEINKLKVSLNEVMEKDKKIQELKNELTLLNQKLQENSGSALQVKELELELKITKKKLDEEYLRSSEVTIARKELEKIKEENNSLRKKMLQMNQEKNLFKLKKIIVKHTKCDVDKLTKILEENDITEESFILNDINEELIKKVMGFLIKK